MAKDDDWIKDIVTISGAIFLGGLFLAALKKYRCPRCNYPLDNNALTCPNCGQPLVWRGI